MNNEPQKRFLNQIARRLRADSPRFDSPKVFYTQRGEKFAEIWVPTNGCRWNKQGYCTTCNYGNPNRVDPEQMIEAVRLALHALSDSMPETLWVGSFNMLDESEVPVKVRRQIFGMLGRTSAKRVLTESHPDSIHAPAVQECIKLLDGRVLGIEIGIESMNDFIRSCCINKDFTRDRIREVVNICHENGAIVLGNFLLGAPFLSHAESVEDTCKSIVLGADMGIDEFVLFPNHVKPYTIAHWLFHHGLCRPPSLWQLVEVLARVEPALQKRIHFAWVNSKDHPGADTELAPSIEDPEPDLIIKNLLEYDDYRAPTVLQWLFQRAQAQQRTINHLLAQPLLPLQNRVVQGYEQMGRAILGDIWWDCYGEAVIDWTLKQVDKIQSPTIPKA